MRCAGFTTLADTIETNGDQSKPQMRAKQCKEEDEHHKREQLCVSLEASIMLQANIDRVSDYAFRAQSDAIPWVVVISVRKAIKDCRCVRGTSAQENGRKYPLNVSR
jgi:hypothetical protein